MGFGLLSLLLPESGEACRCGYDGVMRSDPVEILLTHNRWATGSLLEACAALPDEQFHRSFDMGPGSLHDTMTHILGAMRGWGDMLAGREQRPRLDGEKRTPRQLLELLDEIADDLET